MVTKNGREKKLNFNDDKSPAFSSSTFDHSRHKPSVHVKRMENDEDKKEERKKKKKLKSNWTLNLVALCPLRMLIASCQ